MVKQLAPTNQNSNPLTGVPTASGSTDAVPLAQLTAAITAAINANNLALYPIGAVIGNASTLSANPSTYIPGLSGTTWIPYAAGRTMVGKAASGTFATAGATPGSETHVHGSSQMAAAIYPFWQPNSHYMDFNVRTIGVAWTETSRTRVDGSGQWQNGNFSELNNSGIGIFGNTDSGSSVQPSIVAYMWERTA